MAGADVRRFSIDRRGGRFSFVAGVAHGALLTLAETLLFPTIILTLFVAQLTTDPMKMAMVPVIGTSVWLLPQVLFSSLILRSRRQLPWATGAALIQAASIVLLAYVGYRADMNDDERLRSFFLCYVVFSLSGGLASVPAREVLMRATPRDRRHILFLLRSVTGAVIAIVAGFAMRGLFGPDGPAFPKNFTSLFATAAAALAGATFFQLRLREPARLHATSHLAPTTGLRNAGEVLANANFRRWMLFRVVLIGSTIADPFLFVYARRELFIPLSFLGVYLIAIVAGRFVSAPIWHWLERRGGHRSVLQGAALIRLLIPLIALVLPYIADTKLYEDRFDGNRPLHYLFAIAFVAMGASIGGQIRANFGYLTDIAPAELRPAYSALANAIMVVVGLVPLVGAKLIERYSFDTLLAITVIVGLLAVFVSGILTNTHTRSRPVAQAWRLRGARS